MDASNGNSPWIEPPVAMDPRRRKPLPPVVVDDPNDPAAMKRARNTLAARKSRQKRDRRMLEMQQKLAIYEKADPVPTSSPTAQNFAPNGLTNNHNAMTFKGQPNPSSRNQSIATYETSENDDDASETPEHLCERSVSSSDGDNVEDRMDTDRPSKHENGDHVPSQAAFRLHPRPYVGTPSLNNLLPLPDNASSVMEEISQFPFVRKAALREIKLPDLRSHAIYEASLAQERGKEAEPPCKHCAQTNGPGGIFKKCVVLDGFFDGACANCKSDSMPYRCTFHHANHAPDLNAREMPENMSREARDREIRELGQRILALTEANMMIKDSLSKK